MLILSLSAEEELFLSADFLFTFPEVAWVPLAIQSVSSTELHISVAAGSEILWGELPVWLSIHRREKDEKQRIPIMTGEPIWPWEMEFWRIKINLSIYLSMVVTVQNGSRCCHGHWTWTAQQILYVSSLKCWQLSEYMLCTQSLLGWDQGPFASALHLKKRVKLQSPCLSHLTWPDSIDNKDRKGLLKCNT